MITISTENRLKEIAGNLKRDVKDLLDESARVVTGMFKQGLCTSNGLKKCWKAFTHGLSSVAKSLSDPDFFAPMVLPEHQPLVTVKESNCEDLPEGTQMPLYEAERLIEELNQERWTSDGPAECVNVVIDYRMDNVQDRYYLPLLIGPGQGSMLAQMQHRVEAFLKSPDMTCRDFYTAAPGLSDLLHEQFGPQLQSDLEKLGDRVLGYFQQHCTISRLEQQFEMQAEAMPVKDKKRFQESAKKTVTALRRATNTGQEPGAPLHEQPEQDPSSAPDRQPEQDPASAPDRQPEPDSRQRPRQSVKVQLQQIKEGHAHKQSVVRKTRKGPER